MDPVDDLTYNNIWMGTAKVSEIEIYHEMLVCSTWKLLNMTVLGSGIALFSTQLLPSFSS